MLLEQQMDYVLSKISREKIYLTLRKFFISTDYIFQNLVFSYIIMLTNLFFNLFSISKVLQE